VLEPNAHTHTNISNDFNNKEPVFGTFFDPCTRKALSGLLANDKRLQPWKEKNNYYAVTLNRLLILVSDKTTSGERDLHLIPKPDSLLLRVDNHSLQYFILSFCLIFLFFLLTQMLLFFFTLKCIFEKRKERKMQSETK
jgi:hypothetical protein